MVMKKPKTLDSTAGEVRRGAVLCYENARRFVRNARILLERGGSDGLAYVLWSFAVEEIGKGVLLSQQLPANAESGVQVKVEMSMDHCEKFAAGVRSVSGLDSQKFENLLRVTRNSSASSLTVASPHKATNVVSVGSHQTGTFSLDLDGALDPTVELRLALLYVDWSKADGRFFRPGETIQLPEFVGRWELSHEDLLSAVTAVENHL